MVGKKHRRFGGGLGGTLANSVLSAYATKEQMEAEQAAFNRAVAIQILLDGDTPVRVLGRPRRRTPAWRARMASVL